MDEDLRGKVPPSRPSRSTLVKTHGAHLKAQEENGQAAAERPVKQPILSEAYNASARSIRDLEIIPLSELRVETHHRGQAVVVRAVTPPYRGAGTVTVVEDVYGNADKLAVYNHSDTSVLSNMPEGCVVAVKEPYYKFNAPPRDFMICVDHPSDVVLLRFADPLVPEALRTGSAAAEKALAKTPAEWRAAGDSAFIQRDFPTAVFCYTEALEEASAEDRAFKMGVYAKRAGTNLLLGRYDAARDDALASRAGTPSDWRAYLTAAKAAYGLCDYEASRSLLESALAANPNASGLRREYERCLARLAEEADPGAYDFRAMLETELSPQSVHLDHSSFLARTVVAESARHGRGLFAREAIPAGGVVFVEKATLMPNQYEPARASAALYAMMVRHLYDNPSLAREVFRLYGGDLPRTGAEGSMVDGAPVVDVFLLESIRLKNCFSCPLSTFEDTRPYAATAGRMAKGLWRHASYLNHSCVPNTMRSFVGDIFVSRATRDIAAGEEIFQQYVPVKADLRARQDQFRTGWGFECGCGLCAGEARSPAAAHERRRAALAQVEKLAGKHPPDGQLPPHAAVRAIDRLARQLEALHEAEVYGGEGESAKLPRLALVYPTMWLIRAHRRRKNHAKVVHYSVKLLRNFGFIVPLDAVEEEKGAAAPVVTGEVRSIFTRPGAVSLNTIHVVSVLKYTADAYRAMGQPEAAENFEDAARFGYMIITGFENDLAAIETD